MSQQGSPNVTPTGKFGEAPSPSVSQTSARPAPAPGRKSGHHSSQSGYVDSVEGSTNTVVSKQVKSVHARRGQKKS
jgi:hypothetical protein